MLLCAFRFRCIHAGQQDPNKQVVRVYNVPPDTFESDDDEEDDDDEEN